MKTRLYQGLTGLLCGAALFLAPLAAQASTAPCTPINNHAAVAFDVGGVTQPAASADAPEFNVGVKVMVLVASDDASDVTVSPGVTKKALKFTVTNNGSAVQDYDLASLAAATATADPHGNAADSFDGTTVAIYGDNAGAPDIAGGVISTLDNVTADGGSKDVWIVYTPTDLTEANGSTAGYYLRATTMWADGSAMSYGSGKTPSGAQAGGVCDGSISIDVVPGDADGPATGDAANDGIDSAEGAFLVSSATIGVTKSYTVVSDPINGAGPGAKAIPGAVVRYSIKIENTGGASAVVNTIQDTLEGTLKVVSTAANATWAVTNSTRATTSGTLTVDDADTNGDGLGHADVTNPGGLLTATLTTILAADAVNGYADGELKSTEYVTVTFDATIQ